MRKDEINFHIPYTVVEQPKKEMNTDLAEQMLNRIGIATKKQSQ